MPNVATHAVLADRILDRWREAGGAPFDPEDPHLRNAFHQGSWGPDLGYFPGGEAFFSDLAHYVRSGELARALVRSAGDARERAFAWGWVSHVLADQAIHPLVGRALHEHLHGDRDGFVEAHRARPLHVRLEVGLDMHFCRRHPRLRDLEPAPVFDRTSVGWLGAAYRDTYGLAIDRDLLLASHHAATRMAGRALLIVGMMAKLTGPGSASPPVLVVRWLMERALDVFQEGLGVDPWMLIFLTPFSPPPWLVEATEEAGEGLPDRLQALCEGGLEGFPDYNLDSGEARGEEDRHPCAAEARGRLEALGAKDRGDSSAPSRYRSVRRLPRAG